MKDGAVRLMASSSGKNVSKVDTAKFAEANVKEININRRKIEKEAEKVYKYKELWEAFDDEEEKRVE